MKLASAKLFILLFIVGAVRAVDYCRLCRNHIACRNNGRFAPTCPRDAQMMSLSWQHVKTLLNTHNSARNIVAGGGIRRLKSASRMMTLKWDNELAYLAGLNVKQCRMKHDGCRKTQKYNVPGQNLYWAGATNHRDFNNELKNAVQAWFNEVRFVSQSDIDSCCGGSKFSKIGHFLQLMQDRAVAVGCAASRYTSGGWKSTLIACNYSFGNLGRNPVYRRGSPASNCPNGRNSFFKNLCK